MLLHMDITLDNATLAPAIVTGILALATIGTAIAALWQARSSAASVGLLRKELAVVQAQAELTDDQVKRARYEFFAARQRALAKLHVDGSLTTRASCQDVSPMSLATIPRTRYGSGRGTIE